MTRTADHFAPEGATESTARGDDNEASAPAAGDDRNIDQTPVFRAVFGVFRKRSDGLSPEERQLLLRLLRQIAPNVEISARLNMAHWLADDPGADPALVAVLLNGPFDVARPLLERSPVLTADDLLRVVSSGTPETHRAIASRQRLPGEVSAVLVETDNPEVIGTLLTNNSAQIWRETFDALAAAARRHPELRGALRDRADTPRQLAEELSAEFAADAERSAAALAAKLHRAGHLRVSVLVGALRQRQTALFEHAFALLTGLPAAELRPLLQDRSGFPLALAARAARLDRSAFSTVFVNYCEARGVSPQMDEADIARAMEVFRNLPQEGARAELHRLAGRGNGSTPGRRTLDGALLQAWR